MYNQGHIWSIESYSPYLGCVQLRAALAHDVCQTVQKSLIATNPKRQTLAVVWQLLQCCNAHNAYAVLFFEEEEGSWQLLFTVVCIN